MNRKQSILVVASSGGHLTQAMCATSTLNQDLVLVSNKDMLDGKRFRRVYTVKDTQHNPLVHGLNLFAAIRIGLSDSFLCQWPDVASQYDGAEYHGQAFDLGDHGHQ